MNSMTLAIDVVSPIILLLGIGKFLISIGLIDKAFIKSANKLAYSFFLPALLFSSVSRADMSSLFDGKVLLSGLVGTISAFILFIAVAKWLKFPRAQCGVIAQGGFRANMGIIGLALCANLLGEKGLALASVFLGIMVPIFNLLSIWVLVMFSGASRKPKDVLLQVAKSPLVIAICLALPFSIWSIPIPKIVTTTSALLGQVTLPLALICIGASLVVNEFSTRLKPLILIVLGKAFIYPAITVGLAWGLGVSGDALTVIVIMSMAPTATASFPAAQQLGGDTALAADAVAITTLLSLPLYMLVIALMP